jgi:hypothetical protein
MAPEVDEQLRGEVLKSVAEQDPSLVVCPSGLVGRVRKLRAGDFKLLGDRNAVRSGEAYDTILANVWTDTTTWGSAYHPGKFSWSDALQGDRFVALLAARRRTHGDTMDFDVQCAAAACRRKFSWPVDLSKLTVKPYPVESLRKHLAGEEFAFQLAGRRVTFKLMTGMREKQLERFTRDSKDGEILVDSLAYRLLSVEGLKDPTDKRSIQAWLNDVDLDELLRLREHFDEVSGGVETTLQIECPRGQCGHMQEVELPFGGQAFWTPKKPGMSGKPSTGAAEGEGGAKTS